ncbi:MAG: hypothetical protein ROO76_04105 [Terriglobia bacterium]|jgi:hypothetical protein|nr:hypothetical protein [Terriglobia bacterium]
MESKQDIGLVSSKTIQQEVERRRLYLANSDASAQGAEDALTVASRQVFEELLTRFAATNKAA